MGFANTPEYLRLRHVHGWALRDQGRFHEAAACLTQVLHEQRRLPDGLADPDVLQTRHDLAWTMGRLGHWNDAAAELREVLAESRAQRRRCGRVGDDAFILHTRCKLYWCTGKQGRWEVAERDCRRLLIDRASILDPEHPDTLDTRENLGKALAWQEQWKQAQAEFATLAEGRSRTLGERHPDTLLACQLHAYAVGCQARRHRDQNALRDTISRLEKILEEQEFVRGAEHQNTQDSRAFLTALRDSYTPNMYWTDDLPHPDI